MNKKALLATGAALIAVTGAGVAWQAQRAAREHTAITATARREQTTLATEEARLIREIKAAEQRQTELRGELEKQPAAPGAASSPAPTALVLRSTPGSSDPPEAHVRAMESLKAGLPAQYGAFYRALGLTPDQIAKFENLLVEHDGRKRDIRAVESGIKINPATAESREAITIDGRRVQLRVDPAIAALRREEDARLRHELIALLGATGYAQLQDFNHGAESRAFVSELVGNLVLMAAPLSLEQGQQLTRVLQESSFKVKIEPETNDWTAIAARARPILSAAQFAEFEAQLTKVRHETVGRNELARLVRSWRK
jgi:hypothetical protein